MKCKFDDDLFLFILFVLAQVLTLTMMDHHGFLCRADDFVAEPEVKKNKQKQKKTTRS